MLPGSARCSRQAEARRDRLQPSQSGQRPNARPMIDLGTLSMTEIVRLQNQLQNELRRRFERTLLMAFSDIVGSTPYFARFGDAVGRQLHQLHFDLLGAGRRRRAGTHRRRRRRRRVLRLSRRRGGRARHRRVPAGDGARERGPGARAPARGAHRPALGLGADRRHAGDRRLGSRRRAGRARRRAGRRLPHAPGVPRVRAGAAAALPPDRHARAEGRRPAGRSARARLARPRRVPAPRADRGDRAADRAAAAGHRQLRPPARARGRARQRHRAVPSGPGSARGRSAAGTSSCAARPTACGCARSPTA